MDVFEGLAMRRSTSVFSSRELRREVVARIIEAATWAPNHRHTEPWRFAVLAGGAREELGDRVGAWMRAEFEPAIADRQAESTKKKLVRSPLIIVVSQTRSADDAVQDLEDYAACCCATQNLLLAAHAEGLASKWSTGVLAAAPPVFEYLSLPLEDRIVAFVYLGYPIDDAEPRGPQRATATIDWRGFED
jgi:nitroreductase